MRGSQLRERILQVIEKEWPISVTQIANHLGHYTAGMSERKRKAAVGRVSHHVRQLRAANKIHVKKIGGAVVVWPVAIERLRLLHEFMAEV